VLTAAALLASPPSSIAQETRTQQVQLEQGWNLVSLSVQPDDSSFASIFGANADQIAMIKNEEGEVYAPGEGVEQITTWKSGEGYQIHVKAPLTLGVTGTSIRPDSMSIVLEEGGNVVPYLPSTAQAVKAALVSVEESLVTVRNEQDNQYNPSSPSSSLDSLRLGQAYKVYVDQRDTLRYPRVVNTLDDALALQGMRTGSYVRVRGYSKPEDDGGGTFRVVNSECKTDGGTCFVLDEDLSSKITETLSGKPNPYSLAKANIVWGTLKVRYGPDSEDEIGVKHLHGHNTKTQGPSDSDVDLVNGVVDFSNSLLQLPLDVGHGNHQWDFSYRYATSERRLERVGVTNSVNLAWWGAPKADPNDPQTADPLLKWAINAAARLYQNGSYNWTYVDIPDEYYWLHTTHLRNGVKLRGTGDLISQEWNTKGALTLMPEMALYYNKKNYDPQAPENRDLYHGSTEFRERHVFVNEYNASKLGFQNLRISGNLPNQSVFENLGDYEDAENIIQNSGTWAGFYSTGKFGQSFPDGMVVDLDDMNITEMGNLTIGLSSGDADFQTSNVNLKDGARNHVIYAATGEMDDVTVQGQAWGAISVVGDARTDGTASYTNLTVKNLEVGYYDNGSVLQDRGGPVSIDGFSIDMGGLTSAGVPLVVFNTQNFGSSWKNGTVEGPPSFNQELYVHGQQVAAENEAENPNRAVFENITVTDNGPPIGLHGPSSHRRKHLYRNVTVQTASGVSGAADFGFLGYKNRDPDPNRGKADRVVYENVTIERAYTDPGLFEWADYGASGDKAHPFDTFWDGGSINYVGTDNGYWNSVNTGSDAFRAHLHDVTLNSPPDGLQSFKVDDWYRHMRPDGIIRLRNSQDRSGRTSDATGSYTSDASDEGNDYVLIETGLMSRAFERSATVTSGNRTVQSVEVANSDGTLRPDNNEFQKDPYLRVNLDSAIQAGNTITVDWTARVTPMDRYQTTGLFVTRPWSNRSYTTGNGPWTLDLRGTAASQESREKIVYTASSDDTSVVTASVQSDDYTLELTEQDTGTAMITVTGTIDGVGTTTDTFQVTVE
jgi:hypothetical protein